jgi:hypothetical protein
MSISSEYPASKMHRNITMPFGGLALAEKVAECAINRYIIRGQRSISYIIRLFTASISFLLLFSLSPQNLRLSPGSVPPSPKYLSSSRSTQYVEVEEAV